MVSEWLVTTAPIWGAWLGLVGWLISKIGTNGLRLAGLIITFMLLAFASVIFGVMWGPPGPLSGFFARNIMNLAMLMTFAAVFGFLLAGLSDGGRVERVRIAAEWISVGMAAIGLAFDTYNRATAPFLDWPQIFYDAFRYSGFFSR